MIKSQIGLGILSLPSIMGTLGLVTGLLCIVAIGIIMTCECGPLGVGPVRPTNAQGRTT